MFPEVISLNEIPANIERFFEFSLSEKHKPIL